MQIMVVFFFRFSWCAIDFDHIFCTFKGNILKKIQAFLN